MDFSRVEEELSEVEMALLLAVNAALNASLVAGADANITIEHLAQHKQNFDTRGQQKASLVMEALEALHKHTAGIA